MTVTESVLLTIDETYAAEWADVAYIRISDDRTGEGASPARQRKAIAKASATEGRTITHWFEDLSKSAHKPGVVRDDFEAVLRAVAEHPVQRVWVLHSDRLVRDGDDSDLPRVIKALAPRRVLIRSIESADVKVWTAEGRMTFKLTNTVNAYESERKAERVLISTIDRAEKGRFSGGGRRFGYQQLGTRIARSMDDDGVITEVERPSGKLTLVRHEAAAIRWGYLHIAAGGSLESVVRKWRAHGYTGPTGAVFTASTVRDVLLRGLNAGLSIYYGKVKGRSEAPAIVSVELYRTVEAILTNPARRNSKGGRPPTSLLAPILQCAVCITSPTPNRRNRTKLGAGVRNRGDGRPNTLIYVCAARHSSRNRARLDHVIEAIVLTHIAAHADRFVKPVEAGTDAYSKAAVRVAEIHTEIAAYKARRAELDPGDLIDILRDLRAQLVLVEERMIRISATPATTALVASGDIAGRWSTLTTDEKRTVIMESVDHILVGPAQGKRDVLDGVTITGVDGELIVA